MRWGLHSDRNDFDFSEISDFVFWITASHWSIKGLELEIFEKHIFCYEVTIEQNLVESHKIGWK